MYLTCVRHKIKDFAQFRKAFDINADLLFERAGCQGSYIVQMDGDPLDVMIINLWPSEKHWKGFLELHGSPEFKGKVQGQEEAGGIGEPILWAGTVVE